MIDTERYHSGNNNSNSGHADSHIPSSPSDSHSHIPNQSLIHSPSSNNPLHHHYNNNNNNSNNYQQQSRSMIKSESNQSISSTPPSPLMTSSAPSTPLSDSGIVSNSYNNGNNNGGVNCPQQQQQQQQQGSSRPGYQTCSHANHELWWNTSPELPVSEFYTRSYKCKRCYIKQQTESKKTRQSPIGNGNHNGSHGLSSTTNLYQGVVGHHGNNHSPSSNNGGGYMSHNNGNNSSGSHSSSNNNSTNNNNSNNGNNHLYQNSPSHIDNAINQTFSQNSSILGLASLSQSYQYNNKSQSNHNHGHNQQSSQQYNDKKSLSSSNNNNKYLQQQKKKQQEEIHEFNSGSDQDDNYPINPTNYIDQVINSKHFPMYNKQNANNNNSNNNKPPSPSSSNSTKDLNESDEKRIDQFHYMCSTFNHLVDRDTGSPGYIDSWMKGRLEQTEYFGTIRIQGNLGNNGISNGANSKIGGFFTEIMVSGKTYRGLVFEDLKSSNQSLNYSQQQQQQQQHHHSSNYSPNQSISSTTSTTNKKIKNNQGRDSPTSFLPMMNNSNSNSFTATNENLEALLKLGKQAKNEAVEESKKRKKPYNETDSYALKTNYYG